MAKYFGHFTDRGSVANAFLNTSYCSDFVTPSDFPSDDEMLIAVYETPSYEGYAFVLFERNGQLFEVHGSHCSCYGLEDQWTPEATSWEALAMRPRTSSTDCDEHYFGVPDDAKAALWALIDAQVTH